MCETQLAESLSMEWRAFTTLADKFNMKESTSRIGKSDFRSMFSIVTRDPINGNTVVDGWIVCTVCTIEKKKKSQDYGSLN